MKQQKMQRLSTSFSLSLSRIRKLASLAARMIFTPSLCVLLALASVILALAWVFLDFFAGIGAIDIFAWLPLIVLLAVMALLMTEKWQTVVLILPLLIVTLAGLYYLLLLIGLLALRTAPIIAISGLLLLIMFNGSVLWVTRRLQGAGGQKQRNVRPRRRFFIMFPKTALAVVLGGLFVKVYFWDDPSKRWLLRDLLPYEGTGQKLTLAPPLSLSLQDASHLQSSTVSEIRSPRTVAEVIQSVRDARATHRKISFFGIRHSMGGQALGSNTLHLDMTHLDAVRYNDAEQTITVGPGATWKQIQTTLSQHGRAVRVMQDSNLLSIKGRYYLCYVSYYTQAQLTTMYPEIRTLFALKAHFDPDMLFTNEWYEHYRLGL